MVIQDIIATIKDIIATLKHDATLVNRLSDDTDLVNEVGFDSLGLLQFMLEIEERLNIQIDFNQLEFDYLQSIKVLAEFLAKMPSRILS